MKFHDDFVGGDVELPGTIGLSAHAVSMKTGLTETGVYKLAEAGQFPKSVWLTPGRQVWLAHEVEAWMLERIAEREESVKSPRLSTRGRKKTLPEGVVRFPGKRAGHDDGGGKSAA